MLIYKYLNNVLFTILKHRKSIILFSSIVLILVISVAFFTRDIILNYVLSSKINNYNEKNETKVSYESAGFDGLNTIFLNKLLIPGQFGDTVASINQLSTTFSFWNILFNKIQINNLRIISPFINISYRDSAFNFKSKSKNYSTNKEQTTSNFSEGYHWKINTLLDLAFNLLPPNLSITNGCFNITLNESKSSLHFPSFYINNGSFCDTVRVTENDIFMDWVFKGSIDRKLEKIRVLWTSANNKKVTIPLICNELNTNIYFDSLIYSIGRNDKTHSGVSLSGIASAKGIGIVNKDIANKDIVFNNLVFNYQINFDSNSIELDSNSIFIINKLAINPFIRFESNKYNIINLKITKSDFPSDELFSSLPEGLFANLNGIKTRGKLNYQLILNLNVDLPDSIYFISKLSKNNFSIQSYGNTFLPYINEQFFYTVYEKGDSLRSFWVSEKNPDFRFLNEIPEMLKNAVLISEDGQFFHHKGFAEDAIKQAISTNLKRKKFARGGSTISMQLVKNIFLNRNKNIARKLEEILIVWLIENNNLVSKERMFEIYLNIIEWGPGINGVSEASRFYFNKDVSKLNLAESIFLASIIPKPKKFASQFDQNQKLKDYVIKFYEFILQKMLKKNFITQNEFDQFKFEIEIPGQARSYLNNVDTLINEDNDSILFENYPLTY